MSFDSVGIVANVLFILHSMSYPIITAQEDTGESPESRISAPLCIACTSSVLPESCDGCEKLDRCIVFDGKGYRGEKCTSGHCMKEVLTFTDGSRELHRGCYDGSEYENICPQFCGSEKGNKTAGIREVKFCVCRGHICNRESGIDFAQTTPCSASRHFVRMFLVSIVVLPFTILFQFK